MPNDVNMNTDSAGKRVDNQSEVIAFLSKPESYPEPVASVGCIETHGALVFLAGSKAYKLKRAVKLPYLDFSTVDKRAAACRNELERNRLTAPDIYLACVPLTRGRDGGLAIGGEGEAIDWLVMMKQFDQAQLFGNLATRNSLDCALMEPLAAVIGSYHAQAAQHPELDGEMSVAHVIAQIISAMHDAPKECKTEYADKLAGRMVSALNQHTPLLKQRANAGYVRLCHGDLHLRNIVQYNGKPTLFDALEFNDTLATTDVLYDLAFLLMDLWHRNLKEHANPCFNAYVSGNMNAGALDGLALLPLFMSMRAGIRGMVAIDKLKVASAAYTGHAANAEINEMQGYFKLAEQLLERSSPVLIAVGGLSGTGKTTPSAAMAPYLDNAPGALHLRSDVERKRMFDAAPLDPLPPQAYSAAANHRVYRRLCERTERVLQAGYSVIVDAVFLEPEYRQWIEQVAARAQCGFLGLWLEAEDAQLIDRVTQRKNDASDANADVVRKQLTMNAKAADWIPVATDGQLQVAVQQANAALAQHLGRSLRMEPN